MLLRFKPVVGNWFVNADGDSFEVVAYDRDDQCVEIQYSDGSIEEIDLDTWCEVVTGTTDMPDDWLGGIDLDSEDVEYDYDRSADNDWKNNLDDL
jgi:predicted dehydrogenase